MEDSAPELATLRELRSRMGSGDPAAVADSLAAYLIGTREVHCTKIARRAQVDSASLMPDGGYGSASPTDILMQGVARAAQAATCTLVAEILGLDPVNFYRLMEPVMVNLLPEDPLNPIGLEDLRRVLASHDTGALLFALCPHLRPRPGDGATHGAKGWA